MPSTNKTVKLGLNNWIETDVPKRTDFVADNLLIDAALGNHLDDTDSHLSSDEKSRVSNPIALFDATGTGSGTIEINARFEPKLVIVYKLNAPLVSGTTVNAAIATSRGTSGGITISGSLITLANSTDTSGNTFSMNERYAHYVVAAFK